MNRVWSETVYPDIAIKPEVRPVAMALLMAALAVGADGSFCLMVDHYFGVEGGLQHLLRLGPALVLGGLMSVWLQHRRLPMPGWPLWVAVLGTWGLAYGATVGLQTSWVLATLVAGVFGALAAIVLGRVLAPVLPALCQRSFRTILVLAGGSTGLVGATLFLSPALIQMAAEWHPLVRAFWFNGVLFFPWTLAFFLILERARSTG